MVQKLGLVSVGLVQSTNLVVPNANFQAGSTLPPPGWFVTNGTVAYETSTQYPSKSQSLKLTGTGGSASVWTVTSWAVTAGQQFLLTAALKSDGTATPGAVLTFFDKAGGNLGQGGVSAFTSSTSWTVVTATGAAPANAISMQVQLYNAGATGSRRFDEINIYSLLASSTKLGAQGSIATVSDYTFSYASTTTTITWSWGGFPCTRQAVRLGLSLRPLEPRRHSACRRAERFNLL